MKKRIAHIALLILCCTMLPAQQTLRIVSYNVENLFYPENDSLHNDDEFTPESRRGWGITRYNRKLAHIAQVLTNIGGWQMPAIVGLQEVEEERCLHDLCTYHLRGHQYDYILFEGPDERGVDVGLIYDTTQVRLQATRPLPVPMPEGERPTRDILYASFLLPDSSLLHTFVCHLPSQLGGTQTSAHRREAAHRVLRAQADSLLSADPQAAIVVMGDFNTHPEALFANLTNLMIPLAEQGKGTEKFHGQWSCLDQFFVSSSLLPVVRAEIHEAEFLLEPDPQYLGVRPRRTYQGYKYYTEGFSDHLPIILQLSLFARGGSPHNHDN